MTQRRRRLAWLLGAAGAAMALSAPGAFAQTADEPMATADAVTSSEEIVVPGEIVYRNRSEETAPVLEYGLDYFQRFEPLTVGDMMKRVPSAVFVSDVLEYDGVQLRGLDPGYTQVLINGERVPGSGVDRSFFVDRIPAELVERIEIIRNTSANRSGDAVAGALNIVLRDSMSLDGGYIRGGALYFDDEEVEGTLGGVLGGELGGGARYLIGANFQGRHNPKNKQSFRFDEPGGDFDNREDQSDVRDGEDYSFNGSLSLPVGAGEITFSGVAVHTDRSEIENSFEYEDLTSTDDSVLLTEVPGATFITQDNISLDADFDHPFMGGEIEVDLGYARFEDETNEGEAEIAYDIDEGPLFFEEYSNEAVNSDITDEEFSAGVNWTGGFRDAQLQMGVDFVSKQREGNITVFEAECEAGDCDPSDPDFPPPLEEDGPTDGGLYTIEETRIDPFVMLSATRGNVEWELGFRYETTDLDVEDRDTGETASADYQMLLPSGHLLFNLSENDRLRFSVGRTVRRPNFNFITPALFEGEFEDNDFLGNPNLRPETAWGVDIGFERRLGRRGVIGVNVFYRDVKDLIEIANTGEFTETYLDDLADFEEELQEFLDENPGATPADFDEDPPAPSFVYTAQNTGSGEVWGIEFDLSTPLTFVGLPNTGFFLNYSLLDSEVYDQFGPRRFNNQAESVFNVGVIHDIPTWNMALGATYREQGDAFSRILAEEVTTTYGADLEMFVERRFGERFTVRVTGSNLLDAEKNEVFDKFLNEADQIARNYDEFELETENAGPVFQVVGRYAF